MAESVRHAAFRPSNFLLWLSGARLDVLEQTPTDRAKFLGMGSAVLTSAAMGGVSMAFALRLAISGPVPVAIGFGVAWGLILLNLNRFLAATVTRARNRRSLLLMAAPRLCLSLLVASVISVPFVLQIFSPEISAELPVLQSRRLNAYLAQQQTSPLAKQISADQARVNNLQATIHSGGGPLPDPDKNPAVVTLTAQINKAQAQARADYARWQCELYGGPDCHPGGGTSVRAAEDDYEADVAQVADLRKQLTAVVHQLNESGLASQAAQLNTAKSALPAATAKLRADQGVQQAAVEGFTRANNGTGILDRIDALSLITAGNTTLAAARYLLFALFIVVDFLPMLTRLLLQLGPPSSYDLILETQDRVAADMARRHAEMRLLAADRELAAVELAAELQRASERRRPDSSLARLASFREQAVPHADGELRRLEISEDEFLLVDILDGVPTLNWTASIGAREFALLVSERLERAGDTEGSRGEIMISMAGIADQFDARLGVQLAALASPAFDQRSEFIRFDDPDIALALQSLHGGDGEQVKMFGVSAAGLSLDTVVSLMTRTATRGLAAHSRVAGDSPLIARMAELVHLPRRGDPALRWPVNGKVENAQPQVS